MCSGKQAKGLLGSLDVLRLLGFLEAQGLGFVSLFLGFLGV